MDEAVVKVGQEVRLKDSHQRGRVEEVDQTLLVARVALNDGGSETWALFEDLEILEPWDKQRRTA